MSILIIWFQLLPYNIKKSLLGILSFHYLTEDKRYSGDILPSWQGILESIHFSVLSPVFTGGNPYLVTHSNCLVFLLLLNLTLISSTILYFPLEWTAGTHWGVQITSIFWSALCGLMQIKLNFCLSSTIKWTSGMSESSAEKLSSSLRVLLTRWLGKSDFRGWILLKQSQWGIHPHFPLPLSISSNLLVANSRIRDFLHILQHINQSLLQDVSRYNSQADKG